MKTMVTFGDRCAGHTQKNGARPKINKKYISRPTWAQNTLSAAGTAQVSHELPAVRFSCLLRDAGPVSKMASQQEKAFCELRFEVSRSAITVQREFRARFKKKHHTGGTDSLWTLDACVNAH
jgi:hypothetical protein